MQDFFKNRVLLPGPSGQSLGDSKNNETEGGPGESGHNLIKSTNHLQHKLFNTVKNPKKVKTSKLIVIKKIKCVFTKINKI